MPKRLNVTRRATPEMQGDDSWVEIRRPTMKELDEIRMAHLDTDDPETAVALTNAMIAKFVTGWNWVDEEGNPLPAPNSPDIMQVLTDQEATFIVRLFLPDEKEADVLKKKSNS